MTPLDDAGTLGCPHERPRGIFTPLIALIVGPPTSLRERAFREYREIVRNFRLMSADRGSPNPAPEQHAAASDNALEAATRLVAVDANSSFGWEMLGRVHDARHEATPAITAYRKAAELLAAGAPDLVTIPEEAGWGEQPRPARLQQRIDALSLPQPRFEGAP